MRTADLGKARTGAYNCGSERGAIMSDLPALSRAHGHTPSCLLCDSPEHVVHIDVPEFTHIHHYRCLACGHFWTTNLKGDRIFTGQDDDLMLFV